MSEFEFRLPDIGEGLADAAIVRWLVPEGGALAQMEAMVEVETAKSVVEIPSPVDGVLLSHGAAEGDNLDVGAVLAVLDVPDVVDVPDVLDDSRAPEAPSAAAPTPPAVQTTTASAQRAAAVAEPADTRTGPSAASRRTPAAPTVRRRAAELGIPLEDVRGSGPGGRVLSQDLDEFVAKAASSGSQPDTSSGTQTDGADRTAGADRTEKLSKLRTAIALNLANAWSQVPLITDLRDCDAAGLVAARARIAEEPTRVPVTYTTFFAYIVAAALGRFPSLNASLDLESATVTYHGAINLGIAVSVPGGLSVGVVRDAADLSLRALGEKIATVAEQARAGRLNSEQSTGATFTVSSYGQFGGWYGTPLVVPPQVAIAGFGPIKDKVVPVDGLPAVRPILALSVSADHRLIDGAELSQFCSFIERMVSDPVRILGA